MHIARHEKELYEYPFVIAASHPLPHFFGFYHLLFDKFQRLDMIAFFDNFSEDFLMTYSGKIICLAQFVANPLFLPNRKYETILIDHGPFPSGWRTQKELYVDHLIVNGSEELFRQLNLPGVGHICNVGYFPTDEFLSERKEKTALVQITSRNRRRTWEDSCSWNLKQVCELLLEQGFSVHVYDHVMHFSDIEVLNDLPDSVRIVEPGVDYIHTLSSSSHFVMSGTSGFIANMFTKDCTMIALSYNWAKKNPPLFQKLLFHNCYFAETPNDLIRTLSFESKYNPETTEFLYGSDRENVVGRIEEYLSLL